MKNMKKLLAFTLFLSMSLLQANRQNLIDAALRKDDQTIQANMEYLNKQDKYGDTPLITLIKMKSDAQHDDDQIIDAISCLLRAGADYELINNDGNNPLLKVVSIESYRNNKILDKLLYKKWFGLVATNNTINVEIKDKHGNTPLMRAAGKSNNYAVQQLLRFGADINAINNQGYTALGRAQKEKHKATYALLKSYGATVEKKQALVDEHPFIAAAYENDIAAMEKLLKQDTSIINMQNKDGRTALLIAVAAGNIDAARFLLAQGANPNIKNNDGNSPLLKAVDLPLDNNAVEIVQLLIDNNADVTAEDKYERTPFERTTNPKIKATLTKASPAQK
jgi:ankyrin repeat protein